MADREVRDALTRRLHKNLADPASPEGSPFRSSKLSRPPLSKVCAYTLPPHCLVDGDVRVEGYLYKYSSGQFSRWQKRFFILDAGKLSYYKKLPPVDRLQTSVPKKVFSVRRIRSVLPKARGCDFDLVFSNNRCYQMRASSPEDVTKWVSSIQSAIAYCEANPDCSPLDDDGMSDLGDGSAGSTNSQSNFSEASPTSNFMISLRRDSNASATVIPTNWDVITVDKDALHKNFEEWFYFIPPDNVPGTAVVHREIRVTHVIDACNRFNNNLWSLLGGFPKGTDIKLDEALVRAKARLASSASLLKPTTLIVEQYIQSLALALFKCMDVRSAYISTQQSSFFSDHARVNYPAELPALMECVVRMVSLMDKLFVNESVCACCYCDPSGISILRNARKKNQVVPTTLTCSEEVWRKSFRSILQRLGAELELGLIEELQLVISQYELSSSLSSQHHPLLDTDVLLSQFGPNFVQATQSKCLNSSSQWMAAYPLSARLVAEHVASALVACMNTVARQFKRHAVALSTASGPTGRNGSVNNSSLSGSNANSSIVSEEGGENTLSSLVAFANEAILMNRFCDKSLAKFTPQIFIQCMTSLGEQFLTTAVEVCHCIVKLHFHPVLKYDMLKAWNVKNLVKDKLSPMAHCQVLLLEFISSLKPIALPGVANGCIELISTAVVRSYAPAMIKHKPRLKVLKNLPELFSNDLQIYRDMFTPLVPTERMRSNIQVLEELEKLLNEQNRINFSVYFNSFVALLGSPQQAYVILTAVTRMREHEFASSSERKDVAKMLASMKQMIRGITPEVPDDEMNGDKSAFSLLVVGPCRINWTFEE